MASKHSKNILLSTLAVGIAASSLNALVAVPAQAQALPDNAAATQWAGFAIWPDDLEVVQSSDPNAFQDVAIRVSGNKEGLTFDAENLPRGASIIEKGGEHFIHVPTGRPINRTFVTVIARNREGVENRAQSMIVVHPGWDNNLPNPGDFPTAEPNPRDPLNPPVPPTDEPNPRPEPDPRPTNPPADAGPVVKISDASFVEGQRHEHTFTVSDPDGVAYAYWNQLPGFSLDYVDDDTWKLIIDKSVKAGSYTVEIQGEDQNGNKGKQVRATITITRAENPRPEPDPRPTNPPADAGPVVKISDASFVEGQRHEHTFTVSDPDGVAYAYWNQLPGFSLDYVDDDTWKLIIDETVTAGSYTVEIQGEDQNGNKGKQARATITITPASRTNRAPIIRGGSVSLRRGTARSLRIPVTDPDGDNVTLSIVSGRERWMRIRNGNLELGTTRSVRPRVYNVVIEASDGKLTSRANYRITITR